MNSYNKSLAATVYIVNDNKVLLHKHIKYNTWFPIGGHVEPDELPHEAAMREIAEEAGIEVKLISTEVAPEIELNRVERVPSPFCILHEGIGREEEFLDFIYIGTTTETKLHPMNGESKEYRWFSREELEREDIKVHIKNMALAVHKKIKH